jgi:hypothetical protein
MINADEMVKTAHGIRNFVNLKVAWRTMSESLHD